jgi:hypothetical protein
MSQADIAAAVMLADNKVTHIYELVNARRGAPQVRYVRGHPVWERIPAIAEKHSHEEAVRASDGALAVGPAHAPLIVASDPRHDSPDAFRGRLATELNQADLRIVRGWLYASRHPDSERRRGRESLTARAECESDCC